MAIRVLTLDDSRTWTSLENKDLIDVGSLRLGSLPSTTGALNLSNAGTLKARNFLNSADIELLSLTTADKLSLLSGEMVLESGMVTVANDVVIQGNVTVNGTLFTINSETLTVDDNIIVLNNNVTGTPTENSGIEVERGTSTNVTILWNETTDTWEAGLVGATSKIWTAANDGSGSGLDADTLDTYHASSFPRKDEAATITAAWTFGATNTSLTDAMYLNISANTSQTSVNWRTDTASGHLWHQVVRGSAYATVPSEQEDMILYFYDGTTYNRVWHIDSATRVMNFTVAPTINSTAISLAGHGHAFSEITGTIANAQVPSSAVTQHQASLSLTASQVSDFNAAVDTRLDTTHTITGNWTWTGLLYTDSGLRLQNETGDPFSGVAGYSTLYANAGGVLKTRDGTGTIYTVSMQGHTQAWSTITSTPTTLSGYGITDFDAAIDSRLDTAQTITSNWLFSTSNDPAVGFTGGAADNTAWLYGSIGGVGKFRIQRDGTIKALGFEMRSGSDINAGSVVFNITNAGAITSGSWTATAVGATYGGTGLTSYATGDLVYASAANTLAKLTGNITTTKQFLSQTGSGAVSAAPVWSTVSKSDVGLSAVENTALSTWAGSTSLVTLGTVTTGVWSGTAIGATKGGTGQTTATTGDLLYASATNTWSKLGVGTNGYVLTVSGGLPTWQPGPTSTLSGLGDTTITSVGDNELLQYDSVTGKWINQTLAEAGVSAVGHVHSASETTSGTFADARIALSNITQHQASLTILESQITDSTILARVGSSETITGSWNFTTSPTITRQSDNTVQYHLVLDGGTNAPDLRIGVGSDAGAHNGSSTDIYAYGIGTGGQSVRYYTNNWGYTHEFGSGTQAGAKHGATITYDGSLTTGGTLQGRIKLFTATDAQLSWNAGTIAVDLIAGGTSSINGFTINSSGNVTAGAWQSSTPVGATYGGTGLTSYATGDLVYASAANTLAKLAAGTNGYVLTLVGGVPAWQAGAAGSLNSLSDVTITTIASGEILKWNGTGWINNTLAEAGISATGHTHTTANITDLSSWAGSTAITTLGTIATGVWSGTTIGIAKGGTNATSFTASQFLWYNGTSIVASGYSNSSFATSGHNHTLDSLSNVTITTNSAGEILKWNGSAWINNTLAEADIASAATLSGHTGSTSNPHSVTKAQVGLGSVENTALSTWAGSSSITTLGTIASGTWQGTAIASAYIGSHNQAWSTITSTPTTLAGYGITDAAASSHNHTLDSLSNTTITTNSAGEILKWSGTAWINNTLAEAGISAVGHAHAATDITSGTLDTARLSGSYTGITGVGTIAAGTWQGTAIAAAYIGSHNHSAADVTSGTLAIARGGTNATTYTASQFIWFNGTSLVASGYSNSSFATSSHNHTLDSLSNITITTNSAGEILKWNGTAWINNTLAEADIASAATLSGHTGSTSNPHSVTKAQVGLGSVENTALSTWPGTTSITTVGAVTLGGHLNAANYSLNNVNHILISDPGPMEGIEWGGGAGWAIYESPDDLVTNTSGSLQIAIGSTTRIATFRSTGVLALPVATGTAPFELASTTLNTNLNADLLDGQHGSYYQDAGNLNAGTIASARVSGSYTGITGVGTITTGTWQGTAIASTYIGSHNQAWSTITSTPTTKAGYGITDVPTTSGSGATGTWGISVSGNAATVSNGMYVNATNTVTGRIDISNTPGYVITTTTGNQGLTMYQATPGYDAYMTFYVGGDYAGYFGLGGAENDLVWGGWSVGANRYRIMHSGNYTSWAPSLTGSGASGTWGINVTGTANNITAYSINQNLSTTSMPTFQDVYANTGWFRNYGQTGIYNQSYANHFYAMDANYWAVGAASGTASAGIQLRSNGHNGTLHGYLYGTSTSIGLLDNAGNWRVQATTTGGTLSGTWSGTIANATYATTAGAITSQANSATITASSSVVASQIVQRDGNGYIYANYVNHSSSETENPTIGSFFVSNGDGWTRKATVAHVKTALGSLSETDVIKWALIL